MAYVSRLSRGAYYDPPTTDEHVGPGTYQSLNTYSFNSSPSPFNTSSPRETLECFNKEAMKNPGPGQYFKQIPFITENNGGKEFKSKVGRFDYNIQPNPGPGAYKTKGFTDKYKRSRSAPKRTQPYFTWAKVQMAPTIPAKDQSYGYEMTKSGELIMLKPKTKIYAGDARDSVGPGRYNPDKPATNRLGAKTKYKVDKTDRYDFTKDGKGNPGPGTYDGLTKVPFEKPIKQSPNFMSQVKKGLVFDNADAVLTPGVGSYNLYKGIVPKTSKCGEFDTTAPRFDYRYNGAPGPGSYDSNVASFPPVRKLPQGAREEDVPKIPFHSSTFRFDQGRDEEVPGAGSYPLPSFLEYLYLYLYNENSELHKKRKSSMFNSKVGRFDYDINSTPGPGSYKAPESIHIKPYGQNSQFKSKTKKGEIFIGEKDNPAPGAYTTQLSWKTNNGDHINKDKMPRFDWKTNGVPGPGTYDTGVHSLQIVKPRQGEMLIRSKRFENKIDNIPGPGAYDAEYMYGNLNKPTFNITIAKETKNR